MMAAAAYGLSSLGIIFTNKLVLTTYRFRPLWYWRYFSVLAPFDLGRVG